MATTSWTAVFLAIAFLVIPPGETQASDRCAALQKLDEGDLYRLFDRALAPHRLDFSIEVEYEQIKNSLLGNPIWREGATPRGQGALVRDLRHLRRTLKRWIPSPRRAREPERQPIGLVIDRALARASSPGDVKKAIQTQLPGAYLWRALQGTQKSIGLIDTLMDSLKRNRQVGTGADLQDDLREILAEIDVQVAEYQIRLNNRAVKRKVVVELLVAIHAHCGQSRNPEVQQTGTDLYWLRCPLGQSWNGSTCLGKKKLFDWNEARAACPAGYRLPSRGEFVRLLGSCDDNVGTGTYGYCQGCALSAACSQMFPSDRGFYWSSSVHDDNIAWRADFRDGYVCWGLRHNKSEVRCVGTGP